MIELALNPFRVTILEDCRPQEKLGPLGSLTGKSGWHLGEFNSSDIEGRFPLLVSDSGDHIWGYECWWEPKVDVAGEIPLERKQSFLQSHKAKLIELLGPDLGLI